MQASWHQRLLFCGHARLIPAILEIGSYWVAILLLILARSIIMGSAGFDVGPTNYVRHFSDSHEWAPGVYFYKH
jgi:hypothetical protein